jgi:aminoglycoside phosphotransferase (APT) family kinase protein
VNDAIQPGQLDLPLGRKLAAGRDADVFELADPALSGRVLRRYRSGRYSEREAEIMRQAHAHGYPVPAVYEVRGTDIVMERITGPTMLQEIGRRPWTVPRHARTLARLHHQLARIPPLNWLLPFPPDGPAPANGGALLHLDLHPDNVILSPSGPVAIDWSSAKRGEVAAAVALTWVIMATSELPDTGLRRRIVSLVRRLLVSEFLRHAGRAAALRHLPAVAQFRLSDRNIRPGEQAAIRALLRQHGLVP